MHANEIRCATLEERPGFGIARFLNGTARYAKCANIFVLLVF